jgi:hypothetical protein
MSISAKLAISVFLFLAAVTLVRPASPQMHHMGPQAPPPPSVELRGGQTSLPMQDMGGRPVVDVMINGKGPYRFILDTGARISLIDSELNKELSLPAPAGMVAAPAGGGQAPAIVSVGELRMGDAALRGLIAAVMPLGRLLQGENAPRGVLSASMFPGYLLTFDYPAKRISIKKGALAAADAQSIFEYAEEEDLPTVPIRIAGHDTRVHLDTGSGLGLVLPRKFLGVLPLASPLREDGKAKTHGGEFPISAARVDGEIALGKYKLVLEEIRFSDVSAGPFPPSGNIGYEVLQHFIVTLDSKNRRILFTQ